MTGSPHPGSAELTIDPCLGVADRDVARKRDLGRQQRPCAAYELAFARREP